MRTPRTSSYSQYSQWFSRCALPRISEIDRQSDGVFCVVPQGGYQVDTLQFHTTLNTSGYMEPL